MKQLDVMSYRRVKEAFHRRMVYHIGVDCGFFVEMNYMVNAMLYCLAHHIRFQLYSENANFGIGVGWTEYFLTFCEEVHEPFHKKYNFHRLPAWRRILKVCRQQKSLGPLAWKLKSFPKTMMGRLTHGDRHAVRFLHGDRPDPVISKTKLFFGWGWVEDKI